MLIEIVPLRPEDQDATQKLILADLEEHWGYLDGNRNLDLKNIAVSYAEGIVLVAWVSGEIMATGAFLPRSENTVEVVRMSVAKHLRRQGIGCRILCELCSRAYQSGYKRVILETTESWQGVIKFYEAFGFQITRYAGGDVYFALDLREFIEKNVA